MPTFNIFRETTTRERYTVECETPEQALQWMQNGDLSLDEDEVISGGPATVWLDGEVVLDEATMTIGAAEPNEPETQTFTCKIGVDARAYFDLEIEAMNADEALAKLRNMEASGFPNTIIDEFDSDGRYGAVVLYIRDENESDHHELVPLDYEPFDMPLALESISHGTSIFDQFGLLRSLVGTTDPLGKNEMREIISHLEGTLSPNTYSRRVKTAKRLKAAIDEASKKAVDRYAASPAANPPIS